MYKFLNSVYSENAKNMRRSEIRELLKLTNRPNLISFAGGLPAPDTFPVNDMSRITKIVMDREGKKALQYGPTEGSPALRTALKDWLNKKNKLNLTEENILVVTASQQALDLMGRVFIDPASEIIVGRPTYVGAISAFRAYRADMIGITLDDGGMRIDKLERELKRLANINKRPRFIYVIPDFQNPAGITINLERRKKLLKLAYEYEVLVVEDSPYRELRFNGDSIPSLLSLDDKGFVISLHTFSKIFAPGMRIGWIVADKTIIDKFVIAKQSVDLCTSEFGQRIIAEYMNQGLLEPLVDNTIGKYRKKRDLMLSKLEEHLGDVEGVSWTKPEGGLFLWVTLPESMNDEAEERALFNKAVENGVAYVIGSAFFAETPKYNTLRLNFSYPSEEEIAVGIEKLSNTIKDFLANKGTYTYIPAP